MECLNLRFARIGSKNTVRSVRHSENSGSAMFVYIHDTEMGRPDCRARLEAMNRWTITAYWWKAQWKVLTEHEKENPPYWQLSTKLKILEYLPTLTACFTTFYHPIFHARVSWTCWVLLILCCENLSTTRRAKSTVSPTGYYKLMACIVESGTGMLDSSTGHAGSDVFKSDYAMTMGTRPRSR